MPPIIPQVHVRLVDHSELVLSRINSRLRGGALEVLIHRDGVDPAAEAALERATQRAMIDLMPLIEAGRVPVLRYFLERDIPGRVPFAWDFAPYQADFYLEKGLMPEALTQELQAHANNLLRHFPL
jgi:hypothetical protein